MSQYLIRFATVNDVDDIMNFIRAHWKSDHILAVNKPFFLYEYQDGSDVNFVLGIDAASNEIVGLCGFIKNSKERIGSDIWGSLWKVIKTDNPMLGIQILEFIPENTGCRSFSSVGIAPKTLPIYQFLRFKTDKLSHFYRLKDKETYHVANIMDKKVSPFSTEKNYTLKRISSFDNINQSVFANKNRFPYKDSWYINKRYFEHPIYRYEIFVIEEDPDSILVARTVDCNQTKVLRIVDFIGNISPLAHIGRSLQELIDHENYEYIDFYCSGIESEILQQAGFQRKDDNDKNTIPNYFEPYVSKNVNLYFFNDRDSESFHIFKADGDQDRPNFSN